MIRRRFGRSKLNKHPQAISINCNVAIVRPEDALLLQLIHDGVHPLSRETEHVREFVLRESDDAHLRACLLLILHAESVEQL